MLVGCCIFPHLFGIHHRYPDGASGSQQSYRLWESAESIHSQGWRAQRYPGVMKHLYGWMIAGEEKIKQKKGEAYILTSMARQLKSHIFHSFVNKHLV